MSFYYCPECGSTYADDDWRNDPDHPERRICKNNHPVTELWWVE